jgi:hypothetical protein
MSRSRPVGIATGYGLDDRGVLVRIPVGSTISILHRFQIGSGTHSSLYTKGTEGAISSGVKRPGREPDQQSPITAEVKKEMNQYIHSPYITIE